MREFEFIVSGRLIVGAHCLADAQEAVKDALSDALTDFDAVCVG